MGEIEYPYIDQGVILTTPLSKDLFNKIDGQLVGLTERIGGTWTDATRPTPGAEIPHPIGWNNDRNCYECWDGSAWVEFIIGGGGGGPSPLDGLYTCEASVSVLDAVAQSTTSNKVILASASDASKEAVGIVLTKPTTTTAMVRGMGEVSGYGGLTPGNMVFLSTTAGDLVFNPNFSPIPVEYKLIQRIGTVKNAITIVVRPSVIIEIE